MNRMIQRSRENLKNKKGFTLIELIVVIVIIGILAAIVIPRLSGFSNTAKDKADLATATTIAHAAAAYYASTPAALASSAPSVLGDLLPSTVPAKSQNNGTWSVVIDANGDVTVTDGAGTTVTDK